MAKIVAVCSSKDKGTRKESGSSGILIQNYGLEGDAHADYSTRRQVSLLSIESINRMRQLGYEVGPGDFAENLTLEGLNLASLPVGTKIRIGEEVVLEVTEVGKKCHSGCAIYKQIGKCVMPKEGIFAKVVRGGLVKAGDEVKTETG
jgi:MOSC domain-containing protein YiiM